MSILYTGVFAMLIAEMVFFLILLAPLPTSYRAKIIKFFSKNPMFDQVKYVVRILFVIVVILFVDSVQRSFKTQEKHDSQEQSGHHDRQSDSYLHAKLFQAQRNMYLTGSVIFLSLVLNRFFVMIGELAKNEEKTEVLKQQAAKTTKEYLKLLDKDQKQGGGVDVAALQKELKSAKTDLETIKKQADQTNTSFMELTDRYNALERKHAGDNGSKKDN